MGLTFVDNNVSLIAEDIIAKFQHRDSYTAELLEKRAEICEFNFRMRVIYPKVIAQMYKLRDEHDR